MATYTYAVKVNGEIIPPNTEVRINTEAENAPETAPKKKSAKKASATAENNDC